MMSSDAAKPEENPPNLKVSDLCFGYSGHALFSRFSADFQPGITMVTGGDGRGKTSMLRLLAGALAAQSGQLLINGIDLLVQPANYKAQVFWAEPRSAEFDQLTVPEYFGLQRSNHPYFDDAVLADVTVGLGLQMHLHKQLFMLSTGSRRKVFLAAAFASAAAVTLLDEPFAALDSASIGFVLDWLSHSGIQSKRLWVLADHATPLALTLTQVIELGD